MRITIPVGSPEGWNTVEVDIQPEYVEFTAVANGTTARFRMDGRECQKLIDALEFGRKVVGMANRKRLWCQNCESWQDCVDRNCSVCHHSVTVLASVRMEEVVE